MAAQKGSGNTTSSTATTEQPDALLTESLAQQLAELQLQFGELSATVAGMSSASRVAAAVASAKSEEHTAAGEGGRDGSR